MWSFTDSVSDNSLVKCNGCGEFSLYSEYREGEVYCEDCGSHDTLVCPICGHGEDHVWSSDNPMEVYNA